MPRKYRRREESGSKSESLIASVLDDESNSHHTPHRYADMSSIHERLDLRGCSEERDGPERVSSLVVGEQEVNRVWLYKDSKLIG